MKDENIVYLGTEMKEKSLQEIADYGAGYNYNESTGERKQYDWPLFAIVL